MGKTKPRAPRAKKTRGEKGDVRSVLLRNVAWCAECGAHVSMPCLACSVRRTPAERQALIEAMRRAAAR